MSIRKKASLWLMGIICGLAVIFTDASIIMNLM